jgi:hypothetical protein
MNKVHALTALSLGILASSSGVLQVQAATYNFFVDFSTKEVADYTAYRQTFNDDTYNLNLNYNFEFFGEYSFDSCPTAFTMNMDWRLFVRIDSGATILINSVLLPDFPCTTIPTYYETNIEGSLSSSYLDSLVDDDAKFLTFSPVMIFRQQAATNGRTLYLNNYSFYFDLTYDFGTTYLFNYFLSDQGYLGRTPFGSWTFNIPSISYLNYVYTTAGNDFYYIRNTNTSSIGTTRKKYAVDYNAEFFRGQSVGAGFFVDMLGGSTDQLVLAGSGSDPSLTHAFRYYYLNVSNLAQPIVNVPLINFTTQSCSGGFLDINVGCFINNALAYLTNTAPIISDATQLINAGISFAGQTFGVIGAFTTNNMFGYLVLGGFGFIVIKSLFKNDK